MFDVMRAGGFEAIIARVASDRAVSPEVATEARRILGQFTHNLHSAVDQFTAGTNTADVGLIAAPIERTAAALRLLADAADRAAELIRSNPGSVSFQRRRAGNGGSMRRTWE